MTVTDNEFAAIWTKANQAGIEAGYACTPKPMGVSNANPITGQATNLICVVPDGVCGFAWIKVAGTSAFGRWAKKNHLARPGYPKGLQISCKEFGQSMTRKIAWADAVVKILAQNGIEAHSDYHMD